METGRRLNVFFVGDEPVAVVFHDGGTRQKVVDVHRLADAAMRLSNRTKATHQRIDKWRSRPGLASCPARPAHYGRRLFHSEDVFARRRSNCICWLPRLSFPGLTGWLANSIPIKGICDERGSFNRIANRTPLLHNTWGRCLLCEYQSGGRRMAKKNRSAFRWLATGLVAETEPTAHRVRQKPRVRRMESPGAGRLETTSVRGGRKEKLVSSRCRCRNALRVGIRDR